MPIIDLEHGHPCRVQYTLSDRTRADDAIRDLGIHTLTMKPRIGCYFRDGSRSGDPAVPDGIPPWARERDIDVVIWTALPSNFAWWWRNLSGNGAPAFTVENALSYTKNLRWGFAEALENVWHAPAYIDTPVRRALQAAPWFQQSEPEATDPRPDSRV
jgi:hypothetical protein